MPLLRTGALIILLLQVSMEVRRASLMPQGTILREICFHSWALRQLLSTYSHSELIIPAAVIQAGTTQQSSQRNIKVRRC